MHHLRNAFLLLLLAVGCGVLFGPKLVPHRVVMVGRDCRGYCAAVQRCWPEFYYAECPFDCMRLLAGGQDGSGFTPTIVRCWAEAASCELATACDYASEGGR
jgi:hypothetical protein